MRRRARSSTDEAAPPSRLPSRLFGRFLRSARGAAAVEFALLGLAFTVILCFMIEVGMTILMQSTLSEAGRAASRLIRIGTIQQAGGQEGPFQDAVCAKIRPLMDCSLVRYNVVAGDSFTALPTAIQTDATGQLVGTQFQPGSSEQDVIVQLGYTRDLYFPFLKTLIGTNGRLLIVATTVFQNEPF